MGKGMSTYRVIVKIGRAVEVIDGGEAMQAQRQAPFVALGFSFCCCTVSVRSAGQNVQYRARAAASCSMEQCSVAFTA